jgi:class 3 adenylate cyclase/tetratricopeptide (TPR) repeat protein
MLCQQCGTQLLAGKRFCPGCGAATPDGCPSCGVPIHPSWRFCVDCGATLGLVAEVAERPPSAAERARQIGRPWRNIPAPLAEKIRSAGAVPGERKRTTVLFCDLVGSTAIAEAIDPEEYRELLDRYLELAFAQIDRYEGFVNQLAGDGLMALFGAPITHEDEAERAVRAALGICEAVSRLGAERSEMQEHHLEVRIGINTGIVVVGTVGNDLKMDYTAIGDTTNLAARLQGLAAPGTILISESTARLVEGRFEVDPIGPLRVKGKSEVIRAYEVRAALESAMPMAIAKVRGLTPLVGRAEELKQLEACFDRFRSGLGQVVVVVADDGSGKSRLVYEFRNLIEGTQATVFEARCSSLTHNLAYEPWNAMLRTFLGISTSDSAEEVWRKVAAITGPDGLVAEEHAPYVRRIFGVKTAEIAAEAGDVTLHRMLEAYGGVIRGAAARRPTVMIIEDLHWMDEASRGALQKVMSHVDQGRVMLVVTHRPDHQHELRSKAAITQLRLGPIAETDAIQIIRARAGGDVPRALAERILVRAEGNPFYLEELTRSLVEEGVLRNDGDGVVVTRPVEEIRIPDTVQEVLGARLDRLGASAKRVAQVAAVLGRQFSRDRIEALLQEESIDLDLDVELASLERSGIIHRKGGVGADEFRFGESLTQQVAYEGLLNRERRRLHDRVAMLLLAGGGELDATEIARIGYHLSHGEDTTRGVHKLLEAAENAVALPVYGVAVRLYRQAWTLAEAALEDGTQTTELEEAALRAATGVVHTMVLYSSVDLSGDEDIATRGIELATKLGNKVASARLHSDLGFLVASADRDRFAEGLAMIRRAVAIAEESGEELEQTRLMRDLCWAYLLDGRLEDASLQIDQTLANLDRLGHRETLTDVYMGARFFRGRVLYEADLFSQAEEYSRETYELALRAHNATVQAASSSMIASILVLQGRHPESLEWSSRAIDMARQIQSLPALRSAMASRLTARMASGGVSATDEELDALSGGLLTTGDLGLTVDQITVALMAVGEAERARAVVDLYAARAGGRLREARVALSRGEVGLARSPVVGCGVPAERDFREAIELGSAIGIRSVVGRAQLGLARIAMARGQTRKAVAYAQEAAEIFAALGLGHYTERVHALLSEADGSGPAPSKELGASPAS